MTVSINELMSLHPQKSTQQFVSWLIGKEFNCYLADTKTYCKGTVYDTQGVYQGLTGHLVDVFLWLLDEEGNKFSCLMSECHLLTRSA